MVKYFLSILVVVGLLACGGGKKDEPYIFPSVVPSEGVPQGGGGGPGEGGTPCRNDSDCEDGQLCREEQCTLVTEVVCENDTECEEEKICKEGEDGKKGCVSGCRTDEDCADGERCTENNSCQPVIGEDLCEVEFDSTLTLYIDATRSASDAPSRCENYPPAAEGGEHTDLYCCREPNQMSPEPLNGNDRFCAAPGTLALTRFRGNLPMKLKFDLSNGCKVYVATTDFPEFRLDNSAIEAALAIDGGGTYERLRDHIAVSDCHETENGGISIDGLPLQFMIRIYDNYNRCQICGSDCTDHTTDGEEECVGPAFSRWFSDLSSSANPPPVQSFQILPGLANDFLRLTTGPVEISPLSGTEGVGAISISGLPSSFDPATGKTALSLVTGLIVPNGSESDPERGTGQLGASLGNAVMAAEIKGILRNPAKEDQTIEGLADLRENCGGGGEGGGTTLNLSASLATPLRQGETLIETPPLTTGEGGKIVIDLCLPGTHQDGNCTPVSSADLPFAKQDGDPLFPEIAERFVQRAATLSLTIGAGSNQNIDLNVPDQIGPFKILNANALNSGVFAPIVNSTINLEMEFHPEMAGSGCSSSNGLVTCTTGEVRISESPEIALVLHGFGRPPAPLMELAELNLKEPDQGGTPIPIQYPPPTVMFDEQIVGIQTENRLFRISNRGVRNLELIDIEAQDLNLNFRIGAIYQGESFTNREWCENRESCGDADQWSVPPNGQRDLFFFLNYGPFAKPRITAADRRRQDETLLMIEATNLQPATVQLTGIAKQDRRGTLSVYLEDESRFTASRIECDPNCPDGVRQVTTDAETTHLFRTDNLLVSFRQDGTERDFYLKNDGVSGTEDIVIESRPRFSGTDIGKFCIKWTDLNETECHAEESGEETSESPAFRVTLGPNDPPLKIATIQFDVPEGSTEYRIFESGLQINAYSGRPGSRPKIGGAPSDLGSGTRIDFALKGSNGAPGGTRNLIVHRLMGGMDSRLSESLQKTRILTTATRGILDRAGITDITRYLDRFNLPGGIWLDPVSGTAILKPIFTNIDADRGNPVPATSPDFNGVRIYNAVGSEVGQLQTEHRFQCENYSGLHSCSYFYLYLSDWEAADQSPSCGSGKVTVSRSNFSNILNPTIASEADCIQSYYNDPVSPALAHGTYDPVTGELSFSNLAVRLFSPVVPALGNESIDAILQLALTTECISPGFVPDQAAQSKRLVPENTLNDPGRTPQDTTCEPCFDQALMGLEGRNPVSPYVEGSRCADPNELHGRRLLEPDMSGTLDRGLDGSLPEGSITMDLAGVARISSPNNQAQGTMMYIIIKAEIQ